MFAGTGARADAPAGGGDGQQAQDAGAGGQPAVSPNLHRGIPRRGRVSHRGKHTHLYTRCIYTKPVKRNCVADIVTKSFRAQ